MPKPTERKPKTRRDNDATPTVSINFSTYLPIVLRKLYLATRMSRDNRLESGRKIRVREWRVLMIIAEVGQASSAEVAKIGLSDTGSIARAVAPLLKEGLLIARTPKADRRKQVLALTAEGARAYDQLARQRLDLMEKVMSALHNSERKTLFALLQRLQERAEEINAESQQGEMWLDDE
jgi:DNA-binding MarR family transcriptional regulator